MQINDALASESSMNAAVYTLIGAEFLLTSTPRQLSQMVDSPISSLAVYFIECAAMRWGVNLLIGWIDSRGRPLITMALVGATVYRLIKFYRS